MEMVSVEHYGRVALVKLNNRVANALSPKVVHDLESILRRVNADDAVNGLVLASSNEKFFSIGFDIPELFEMNKDDFRGFYRLFNQMCMDLFTMPKPTVAAITGHAIAGGCILALCCDYRFIAKGHKLMGLNEVKLGLPVPYMPDRVLHALAGVRIAQEMMESGEFYPPEKAFEMGIVDKILPVEDVVKAALEHADTLGSLPKVGYGMIKQNRVEVIAESVMARQDQKETAFIGSWYSDEARERLQAAMKRF
ncbi:MAG: enoyl-CoA hydratase/isomerase family protein [Desulfobacterales bacterium]